jgi:hypothetical protein
LARLETEFFLPQRPQSLYLFSVHSALSVVNFKIVIYACAEYLKIRIEENLTMKRNEVKVWIMRLKIFS